MFNGSLVGRDRTADLKEHRAKAVSLLQDRARMRLGTDKPEEFAKHLRNGGAQAVLILEITSRIDQSQKIVGGFKLQCELQAKYGSDFDTFFYAQVCGDVQASITDYVSRQIKLDIDESGRDSIRAMLS